jgi:G3E family GTPase
MQGTDILHTKLIPIYVVSGFLGSGKTTLISALLHQPTMKGSAVVVNEFGEVGIDDAIFAETLDSENILLLANGCLCCTSRDDLTATVRTLTRRPDLPHRIFVETTGLADPTAVLLALMSDAALQRSAILGGLITTVDAVHGLEDLDEHAVALRQAAVADCRIITKSDLTKPPALSALITRLTELNPSGAIRVVSHGEISAEELCEAAAFDPFTRGTDLDMWMNLEAHRRSPLHGQYASVGSDRFQAELGVRAWLVEEARRVNWTTFSARLGIIIGRYGDVMLRLKGVLHTEDDQRPLVFHGVQRLFHPPMRLTRQATETRSSVVVIGEPRAGIAVAEIKKALADATSSAKPN